MFFIIKLKGQISWMKIPTTKQNNNKGTAAEWNNKEIKEKKKRGSTTRRKFNGPQKS